MTALRGAARSGLAQGDAYTVRLEVFEGPLDLLLHLIRKEEMDIYDIPIARITRQYLDYLERAEALDLDRASEFLLMAATLMDIKSRLLLPRPPEDHFIDEEARSDPRRELVARLLEYKRYKETAGVLARLAESSRRRHSRYGSRGSPPEGEMLAEVRGRVRSVAPEVVPAAPSEEKDTVGVRITDLVGVLHSVLRSFEQRKPFEVILETYSVNDRIGELAPLLLRAGDKGLDFSAVLRRASSRRGVVITFMALLELLRRGLVTFAQEGTFGPIRVWARAGMAQRGWVEDV